MKKIIILFILIPFLGFSQIKDKLDYISPYNEGFSAVKKGNQWAFINLKGNIVIDFRDNLVLTETNNKKYPVFINERCLISEKKDGISYFGYIDTSGTTIIEPQFLNATNFDEEFAIAIELYKEILGKNNILDKQTVRYESTEVIINKSGIIIRKLTEPKGLALSRNYINKPPKISSKIIAENLFSALGKDNKIIIKKIKE
ncbi:WG containing repeat-containing protein [Polaribacter sp. Hel1_33_78]|uniref:WG repeat-containing protein n=1 Tax=Polaribacter sp. Hel1_33_78 TaxID=1336804 RepID=UPI00087B00B0|nr:WG repeat-containing protein [Polaribacter sp. Hel1_33_78]SDT88162.1 WG containing repeat-containing protein [Polaribacter sp. Hel1_33_78]